VPREKLQCLNGSSKQENDDDDDDDLHAGKKSLRNYSFVNKALFAEAFLPLLFESEITRPMP
jgi:hypothetical protein